VQSGSATSWSLPFQAGKLLGLPELLMQPPLAQIRFLAHAQSGATKKGGAAVTNSIDAALPASWATVNPDARAAPGASAPFSELCARDRQVPA
jgi:hypothetical protein